jgi:hydroxylamine reductase (hybrid-cluster protein)
MTSQKMQKAALVTRDAHQALLDLKKLVDSAAQKTRAAELEAVGLAVGSSQGEDALITLRSVAETIGSSDFDAAVQQARKKIETAVASHLSPEQL